MESQKSPAILLTPESQIAWTDLTKTRFEASALSSSVTIVIPASSPNVDHMLPRLDVVSAVIEGFLEGAKEERRLGALEAFDVITSPFAEIEEVGLRFPVDLDVKLFALGRSPDEAEAIDPLDVAPKACASG